MNNIVDSSMPVEIQFYSKIIHRWIEIDNNKKFCVHQEEEEELEQGCLHMNEDVFAENFEELMISKVSSNWPTLDLEQTDAEYRFREINKEMIRVSFVVRLYQDYVCDKTMMHRSASLSLIKSLKKKTINSDDDKNCCTICLGDFAAGMQLNCMPCSHYFHIQCLWSWLQKRGNCPICRYEMPTQYIKYS